jgi:SNF2 family DNA or RNA helicase
VLIGFQLWALLHFIMPTLFDSHEEFNEWFSKDIESHAENKSAIDESEYMMSFLFFLLTSVGNCIIVCFLLFEKVFFYCIYKNWGGVLL